MSGFYSILFTLAFLPCAHLAFLVEAIHFSRKLTRLRSLFNMFNLIIHVKLYSSVKFSSVTSRCRNPIPFYYILHFTIFGKLNFPSVEAPDSRPCVLCKEVGSWLVASAPHPAGAPLPSVILSVPQAQCHSGWPLRREPLCGEQGGGKVTVS